MAELAAELARQGCDVTYVSEQMMSAEREEQGWVSPNLGAARLELVPTEADVVALVAKASLDSIHICQGIRSNGLVGVAQRCLARRGIRQ